MNERHRRSVSLASLALGAWCVLAACAASTPAGQTKSQVPVRAGSPDELLASAAVAYRTKRDMGQVLVYVRSAAERAPDRADIAWVYARVCSEVRGCEPEPLETQVRKLDPRNAVVWMGALTRAQQRNDRPAEQQILEAMANGAYVDLYWNPLLAKVSIALKDMPGQPKTADGANSLSAALDDTTAWLSATVVPKFDAIARACSSERLADPNVAARCMRVANALQNGDTYLAEGVGLGIAERAARPGTAEAFTVADRIATSRYQREMASRVMAVQIDREKFSAELVELTQQVRREQDVFLAVLRWSGEPLKPQ